MKFQTPQTLEKIAAILNCDFIGNADFPVLGMNEIHVVTAGDIVFVDHPKYYEKALNSAATVVLINKKVDCPVGKSLLISDDPFRDFNKLTKHFKPFISASVNIDPKAKIGEGTQLQPGIFIGPNVQIGSNCLIHANVTIVSDTYIGDNVVIGSGTVIGGDAFYYKNRPEGLRSNCNIWWSGMLLKITFTLELWLYHRPWRHRRYYHWRWKQIGQSNPGGPRHHS